MRICGTLIRQASRAAGALMLLVFLAVPAPGANPGVAELERALVAAAPAGKSALLVQLSAAIEADDMTRAWDYAQQARREAGTPAEEIAADTRIASLQRRRGSYVDSLATGQAALTRAVALGDRNLQADVLLVIASTHNSLADFPAALETFQQLLPLAEARGDALFLAKLHNNLGVTHVEAGQPDLAKRAYETARVHADKAGDHRMVSALLNNLGNLALNSGNLAESRKYHEEALRVRESAGGDTRGIADSSQNLAELAMAEGHPADALPYLDRAIALHTSLGLKRNLTNAHLSYASALLALNRMDDALGHLNTAQGLADALKSPTITARVHRGFALLQEARGDYRAALQSERKWAAANEAAIGERSRQRLDTLQVRFAAERRQHEIDVLRRDQAVSEAQLGRVRTQRYGLLALLLIGVIVAGTLVSRHRLKRRTDQRILAEATAARQTAEEAAALKTQLIGMVSHDIRGPVGNILTMGEELRSDPSIPAGDQRVQLIVHEASHVLGLSQDLLDAAALENGRLQLQTAPVDLAEIIRATLGRIGMTAGAKGQKVEFTPPAAADGLVTADAGRLAQVITNLVSNAIKYSPRNSTVRISLAREKDRVRLAVQDEGPGIAAADLPHLFRPFSRLSARPTGGESSHGLGLAIAHDLVRLHGGNILVDSSPGRGATFTVELPISA